MAPFVEREWGAKAFAAMRAVKELFDPKNILNPGVIFNDDPNCFVGDFKPLPTTSPTVDKCIECGFCEPNCLTCGLTLSSRQRVVVRREISRLERDGSDPARLAELKREYEIPGIATCAGDGLCSTSCPMKINVGELTRELRAENAPPGGLHWKLGDLAARRLAEVKSGLRPVLRLARVGRAVLGKRGTTTVGRALHRVGFPLWTPALPKPFKIKRRRLPNVEFVEPVGGGKMGKTGGVGKIGEAGDAGKKAASKRREPSSTANKIVYFPSCINQTMGASGNERPLVEATVGLLEKAGFSVVFPPGYENLCCGTIWESKGMPDVADRKTAELEEALFVASNGGEYPILCDQSPCLLRMKEKMTRLRLFEPIELIETFLVERLDFTPIDEPIAIHATCSTRKMGLLPLLTRLAGRCSTDVLLPEEIGCCGFAGDKGFVMPEVNAFALRKLEPQLKRRAVVAGYSTSRTCEIGLTTNGGVPYSSIVYLVDRVTTPKK